MANETDSLDEPMARCPPAGSTGMPLARAAVLGALFGEHSVVGTFGRFRVLDRLGAGGMGVVYEAYDPELARGVALKLVGVTASGSRAALAEAKTLARLSHPNVVPIYDLGVEQDHVYLVMELVRGKTLREWSTQRAAREILAVYHQAGAALAAAHREGIVHRDFKPDNAIVGGDGRVRVVDFGLACELDAGGATAPRSIAGTPRFMAPEGKAGIATPAADQYSFCVALAESLAEGREPLPRWVGRVLERGRSQAPEARYPSMEALLAALARDPARTRRRALAAGAVVAAMAALLYYARAQPVAAPTCDDGADRLAAAWSPASRGAALDRVATLGPHGPPLRPLLAGALDAYDRGWAKAYRDACVDRRSGTESDALIDRRTQCLQRGRDALAAVGALVEHAEASTLVELPRAVQSMPDPAACSDRKALLSDLPPPPPGLGDLLAQLRRRVEDARIRIAAGRYDEALREGEVTVALARQLGYGPALADALLVQGQARTKLDHHDEAVPMLTEAAKVAIASHADAVAVEAWARRIYAQGTTTSDYAAIASADLEVIDALAGRTEGATFARALLYNNLGNLALANDRRADARAAFQRALTEAQRLGQPGPLELAVIPANLGLAIDDHARGEQLLNQAIAELSARLGADHPDTLLVRQMQVQVTTEDLARAAELLEPVCRAEQADPGLAGGTVDCWTEVGLLRADLGDRARAIEALIAATHARGDTREAEAYVSLLRGDAAGAARQFAAAVAAQRPRPTEHWWDRLIRARFALGLGRARRQSGDLAGARTALEAAVAALAPIVEVHPAVTYERRLGRARVELALVLSAGAPSAARAAAVSAALAWLDKVGGRRDEIEQLLRVR